MISVPKVPPSPLLYFVPLAMAVGYAGGAGVTKFLENFKVKNQLMLEDYKKLHPEEFNPPRKL